LPAGLQVGRSRLAGFPFALDHLLLSLVSRSTDAQHRSLGMATANYSLLSIPATFVLGMAAHWNAIILSSSSKDLPAFDNRAPRAFLASVSQLAKTSAVRPLSPLLVPPSPPFPSSLPPALLASLSPLPWLALRRANADAEQVQQDARQYLRAEAAQTNIFEQLGLYAAAVLCGNWARLPTSFLNKATGAYVVLRAVYCVRRSVLLSRSSPLLSSRSKRRSFGRSSFHYTR